MPIKHSTKFYLIPQDQVSVVPLNNVTQEQAQQQAQELSNKLNKAVSIHGLIHLGSVAPQAPFILAAKG